MTSPRRASRIVGTSARHQSQVGPAEAPGNQVRPSSAAWVVTRDLVPGLIRGAGASTAPDVLPALEACRREPFSFSHGNPFHAANLAAQKLRKGTPLTRARSTSKLEPDRKSEGVPQYERRGLDSAAFSFVQLFDRQSFRLLGPGSKLRLRCSAVRPGSTTKWARQSGIGRRRRHPADHAEHLTLDQASMSDPNSCFAC